MYVETRKQCMLMYIEKWGHGEKMQFYYMHFIVFFICVYIIWHVYHIKIINVKARVYISQYVVWAASGEVIRNEIKANPIGDIFFIFSF